MSKRRKLWVRIAWEDRPRTMRWSQVYKILLESIDNGDYALPNGWEGLQICWKNRAHLPYRCGPWQDEMIASARSSYGWVLAVQRILGERLATAKDREEIAEKRGLLARLREWYLQGDRELIELNRRGTINDIRALVERARLRTQYEQQLIRATGNKRLRLKGFGRDVTEQ